MGVMSSRGLPTVSGWDPVQGENRTFCLFVWASPGWGQVCIWNSGFQWASQRATKDGPRPVRVLYPEPASEGVALQAQP